MKKGLSFLLCFFLILYLLLSPSLIEDGLGKNIFAIRKNALSQDYRGTLELWHVVSFKTPAGSGYQHLREIADAFEKSTPYVFIEIRGITAEAAAELMEKGERPDMISYPMGFVNEEELTETEPPEGISERIKELCGRGVPYMADRYVMVSNNDLLRERGIERGFDGELSPETLEQIFEKSGEYAPVAFTDCYGTNPRKIMEGSAQSAGEPEMFRAGKALLYLCPSAEYETVIKKTVNFGTTCYEYTDDTDLIQKIGIYESGDEAKNEMMERFMERLFTDRAQKKLCALGMMPCKVLESAYEDDAERQEVYRRFLEKARVLK